MRVGAAISQTLGKTMKKYLVVIILASILCGCDNSEELVFDDSDTVSAVRCRSERFQQLLLGSPARPYSGTPPITLRTPGLGEVQITGTIEGRLSQLCESSERLDASEKSCIGSHPNRGPRIGGDVWGPGTWMTTLLDAKAVSIELVDRDGAIVGVAIYGGSAEGAPLVEMMTEGSDWHAFPLSGEALSDLFGAPRASYQWMAE
jgi:hypothetical protein